MPRLYRPHIPLKVRIAVANRQCHERAISADKWPPPMREESESEGIFLKRELIFLFGDRPYALDHDPALVNRRKRQVRTYDKKTDGVKLVTVYSPAANDPRFLRYREAGKPGDGSEHDIKTRVRGDGAQLSDLAKARKAKKVKRNRQEGRGAAPAHFTKSINKSVRKMKSKRKETFREFERRFDRGDPSTIDRKATANFNRYMAEKKKARSTFPPKGSRKVQWWKR